MSKRRIFPVIIMMAMISVAIVIAGCTDSTGGGPSGNVRELQTQQNQTTQYESSQPNPFFKSSAYRGVLQKAETVQADGLQGTAFFMTFSGYPVYTCPEIGSPVPNTAQLSNPQQPIPDPNNRYNNGYDPGSVIVGQMDPNGVYSPSASSGTYVMCNTAAGEELLYWEGDVLSISGPALWDWALNNGHGGIKLLGPPTKIVVPPPASKK